MGDIAVFGRSAEERDENLELKKLNQGVKIQQREMWDQEGESNLLWTRL